MNKNKHITILNTVYNIDIIIANRHVTLKDLQKKYTYYNGDELEESIIDCQASTTCCKYKNTGKPCILIKDNKDSSVKGINKKLDLINTASHEALHAAIDIYSYIGETINTSESNESLAYFIGWLTQHIYETFTKK